MTRSMLLVCIGLGVAILVGAFAERSQWVLALVSLAIGLAWLLAEWRGWGNAAPPGMAGISILAAVGILYGFTPYLMALVSVLALSAWDLSRFRWRLLGAATDSARRSLEGIHLRRLLLVDVLGLLAAALAIGLPLHVGFYPLFLLGVLALLAIYGVLRQIGKWGSD